MKIKLIYLAAGNSRRFGKKGENKLFYQLDGKPMYRHLLERLVRICRRHTDWKILVVTQYGKILEEIRELPVTGVFSEESYKGASYSVKAGIRAAEEADAFAFFVADQPYFSEKSAEEFLEKMEREAVNVPGCVTWKGRQGNPVWFPKKYEKELMQLEGDRGGRKVFLRHQEQAVFYEVGSGEELEDLDIMPAESGCQVRWKKEGAVRLGNSLLEALGLEREENPVIAAVGAGGKTSLLMQLTEEYRRAERKPVVTTTTHMKWEDVPYFVTEDSMQAILEVREREGMVVAGQKDSWGKIKSLSGEVLAGLWELGAPVLVEADGARMLPVKVPGKEEPVIPENTTIVLSVYGLDAVGKPLKEICFRPELAARILKKQQTDLLTKEDLVYLAANACGGRKGVARQMEYVVVLNKADDENRRKLAEEIAEKLAKENGEKVLITSFR